MKLFRMNLQIWFWKLRKLYWGKLFRKIQGIQHIKGNPLSTSVKTPTYLLKLLQLLQQTTETLATFATFIPYFKRIILNSSEMCYKITCQQLWHLLFYLERIKNWNKLFRIGVKITLVQNLLSIGVKITLVKYWGQNYTC